MTNPKATLADYSPEEIRSIVAIRCQALSAHLGWSLVPPAVKVLPSGELKEAMHADVLARAEKVRGGPREHKEGFLASLASMLLEFMSPSVLGYFGTSENTLYLNAELAPPQAAYVLLHELIHAAQWQRYPGLFALIDAGRVATEDLIDRVGDEAAQAVAARDRYESLVTFIEGHATFHGRVATEQRLRRDATGVTAEEAHAFVEAMMGLDRDDEMTALIYVRGEQALAAMTQAEVEATFADPELAVKRFTRLKA